jgi:hypothetical protein
MKRLGNVVCLLLMLIVILSTGSLIIKPTSAQTIPKPSVPEFTLSLVSHPFNMVTPTKTIHFENKSIDVIIKNQPFTPYNDITIHTRVELRYQIQFKEHNATDWQLYSDSNTATPVYFTYFTSQSTSKYTVISVPVNSDDPINLDGAHVGSLTNFPEGSQVDFQVRALIGQPFVNEQGGGYTPFFKGETGNWSDTQIITITESSVSPSPTPAVPELPWLIILPLLLSVFSAALVNRHRKTAKV